MAAHVAERAHYLADAVSLSHDVPLVNPTAIAVGNHLTLRFLFNATPTPTITDPRDNTWHIDFAHNAGSNHTTVIASCRVTTAYQASDEIIIALSGSNERDMIAVVDEWSGVDDSSWKGESSGGVEETSESLWNSGGINTGGACIQIGVLGHHSTSGVTVDDEAGHPTEWTPLGAGVTTNVVRTMLGHYRIVNEAETSIAYNGEMSPSRINSASIVEYFIDAVDLPDAPTDLSATAISYKKIGLAWTDNTGGTAAYKIERAPDDSGSPGTWAQVGTTAVGATAHTDNWLDPEVRYWYRVIAFNAAGDSDPSNIDDATTPAFAPNESAPPVSHGIWTSKADLDERPTSGDTWTGTGELFTVADGTWTFMAVHERDDPDYSRRVMAGALVAARLKPANGDADATADAMRLKVHEAITATVAAPDDLSESVTWPSRVLGIWPIVADLINLEAFDPDLDADFRAWLAHNLDLVYNQSIRLTSRFRPPNIGSSARWSRATASIYLGDTADLNALADIMRRWLGDTTLPDTFTEGPGGWHDNQSWQADPEDSSTWVGINPLGATRDGHNFDGIQPEDQRRHDEDGATGGVYDPEDFPTPATSRYPELALYAALGVAYVMHRAGYTDLLTHSDSALLRAAEQTKRFADEYAAKGYVYLEQSYEAVRPLINYLYGTEMPETRERGQLGGSHSHYAWTYYTHQGSVLSLPGATLSRFRWREDDGNEAEATWRAAEDAHAAAQVDETVRLRVQIQADGDMGEVAAELRWRKKGTEDPWEPVQ